jgi:hypothetical protein
MGAPRLPQARHLWQREHDYNRTTHICGDCRATPNILFGLKNEVWHLACPTPEARRLVLCLGCTARRLGRPLKRTDFNDHPSNALALRTLRL